MNLVKYQRQLNKIFQSHQVVLAYVFGSAARGKAGPLSDIDIAVLFSDKVKREDYFDRELSLATEIGKLLKVGQVDIVNLKTVSNPLLEHDIVFEGKPILVKDEKLRFEIENQIMKEYEDTKHLREVQNRIMREQIKEGTFGKPLISPHRSKVLEKYGIH